MGFALSGFRGGGRHHFLSSLLCEDNSRTAERTDRRNCARAALPVSSSGAKPCENYGQG
ncbi:hypothetical protein G6L28_21570 [Agrobacterium larrymoorei]|nr:hypothetical protein [Agrobacterium larrymoorei]